MIDEYITVKEAAAAAGVTTQRIYQLLAKDLQSYCKEENGKKYVNIKILERFKNEELQSACKAFTNDLPSTYQEQNDKLRAEVDEMREQIASKDKTIDRLQLQIDSLREQIGARDIIINDLKADKDKLNSRLDAADTNISNLTTALQAAQALHGIDKKQTVIDMAAAEDQTSPEAAEDPPQQKLSLLQRLFKRK